MADSYALEHPAREDSDMRLPQNFDLSGRTALITGAGGLLGPQHAAALAAIGARIVLTDVDQIALQNSVEQVRAAVPGAECVLARLDVRIPEEVRSIAADLQHQVGPIDVLINNAAIDPKVTDSQGLLHSSRFEAIQLEQWNLELAVGLTGAMLCAQTFGAAMAERGGGVILNIASDLAVIAPDQRLYRREDVTAETEQPVKPVTYSVIKHGLLGLTKYLATYWAHNGVRVNALSPGGVFNEQDPSFVSRLTKLIPAGRMAAPDEYRGVVQFLCSDASAYMTGQNVVIDGGRSVW
jgi:NAD(P)-dependent dehydrogenase (short-subunit alcohol dehydrogenase family)